jgi:hypothetical protein
MIAATLALLLCGLLLREVQGAQLKITSVSVGGVNQTVGSGNLLPFVDISSVSGVSSESYLVVLQVQNSATYQINVSAVDVQLYSGTYPSYIPPNAPIIPIDSSMVSAARRKSF